MAEIVMTIIKTLSLFLNAIVLTICLPRKRPFPVVILGWATLGGVSYLIERLSGILPDLSVMNSVLFVPFVLWAFKGHFFQMMFAMILPMFLTVSQQLFIEVVLRFLIPYGTDSYWLTYLIAVIIVSAIYIYLVFRLGKRLLEKLFVQGRTSEWVLYSFSSLLSLLSMMILYKLLIESNTFALLLALCIITWGYAMLCFAIVNTHEKLAAQYERDLSREIISSGRDYYDKLTDMTEQLHIMRHDYKHHLTSMQKLMETGDANEARDYLLKFNEKTDENALKEYCGSRVLNALLDSFAERCEKEKIAFTVKILLPPDMVDDYELCIITGNLLENAITGCRHTPEGKRRYIELSMRPRDDKFGIKVENSYDGVLKNEGKTLFSTKSGGGLGINSIKSVALRHKGEYVPVWDDEKFSAFVVLKLEDE